MAGQQWDWNSRGRWEHRWEVSIWWEQAVPFMANFSKSISLFQRAHCGIPTKNLAEIFDSTT